MHEMSIAVEVIREVENSIAEHNVERVDEVVLTIGVMRQVVPEMLETAFEAAAKGTRMEGARLSMEFVESLARCRPCGAQFAPEAGSFLCPRCGQADVEIVQGDEIILTSLTCEEKNGASANED